MSRKQGFTLIELSIVLVIIGLIVGGILVGRELIQASERQAVIREQTQFKTALNVFRMRYKGLPGDTSSATLYWGKNTTDCSGDPGSPGTPGTCNGNGDGRIGPGSEIWRSWQHLSMAGLIQGDFSGKPDALGNRVIGVTVPRSRFPGGGWNLARVSAVIFGRAPKHLLEISGAFNGLNWDNGAIFRAVDAEAIDQKADDGKPDSGKVFFLKGDTALGPHPDCVANSHTAPTAGAVNLTSDELACRMYFWID